MPDHKGRTLGELVEPLTFQRWSLRGERGPQASDIIDALRALGFWDAEVRGGAFVEDDAGEGPTFISPDGMNDFDWPDLPDGQRVRVLVVPVEEGEDG